MTDRPILFSGPMVRAIIDGRKTQTRRPMKTPPTVPFSTVCRDAAGMFTGDEWGNELERLNVPHAPGDCLWVRESVWINGRWISTEDETGERGSRWVATKHIRRMADDQMPIGCGGMVWRSIPSIHMPRWASRLTLIVTDVRVQRLREISEEDAIAEGVRVLALQSPDDPTAWWEVEPGRCQARSPIAIYASLWDACYGSGAWEANPWVVATTFTVHHLNIDKMREE